MRQNLRILIADDQPEVLVYLTALLEKIGHKVVGAAKDGLEAFQMSATLNPDLIITDIAMPEMSGLDLADAVYRQRPTPFIIVTGLFQADMIERAARGAVYSYLVKPVEEKDLRPAIELALAKNEELNDLRRKLEDRKKIERAKEILMLQKTLTGPAAHKELQKMAKDRNKRVVDIAEAILLLGDRS